MQTEIVGIILSALPSYSRQQFWALYIHVLASNQVSELST